MIHPFEKYFRKHDHYPRVRIVSGVQKISIEFAPGYVRIRSYPWGGEVYITRSAWISLLRKVIPLTRKWSVHQDFDVPSATRDAFLTELALLQEKREGKRSRRESEGQEDLDRRDRQRQRFLAAQRRSARRGSEE